MVRRATKKNRQQANRRERRLLVIATEGNNKTERNYFNEFNSKQNQYRITFAGGNDTDPVNIVRNAIDAVKKEELNYIDGDMAYAIFDTDFGKEEQIREAISIAEKNKIKVILSNPCFEIWLLFHFEYSTREYISNENVIETLQKQWNKYSKNILSYEEISCKTKDAIQNARKIKRHFKEIKQYDDVLYCNPSTDVDLIVELLVS